MINAAAAFLYAIGRATARSEARHEARATPVPTENRPGPQVATLFTWSGSTWTRSPLDEAGLAGARAGRVPVYSTMHEFDAHLPGSYPRGAVVLDGVSR